MTRRFLTASQVADLLQIQERTVNRWLRTGYLRGFKVSKERRIRAGDLESFLEMHANHDQPLVAKSFQESEPARRKGEKVLH